MPLVRPIAQAYRPLPLDKVSGVENSNLQKWSAKFLGTFWLTFGGCGSAVLAAAFPELGIGLEHSPGG